MESSGMKVYNNNEMLAWVGNFADRMEVSPEKIKILNICGKKKNVLPTIETHKRVMIFADESFMNCGKAAMVIMTCGLVRALQQVTKSRHAKSKR